MYFVLEATISTKKVSMSNSTTEERFKNDQTLIAVKFSLLGRIKAVYFFGHLVGKQMNSLFRVQLHS